MTEQTLYVEYGNELTDFSKASQSFIASQLEFPLEVKPEVFEELIKTYEAGAFNATLTEAVGVYLWDIYKFHIQFGVSHLEALFEQYEVFFTELDTYQRGFWKSDFVDLYYIPQPLFIEGEVNPNFLQRDDLFTVDFVSVEEYYAAINLSQYREELSWALSTSRFNVAVRSGV